MPGVVYVVAAMATSWCIRRVAVAEQPEAAGRVLVVQSQHGDEVLPFEAREVLNITAPH